MIRLCTRWTAGHPVFVTLPLWTVSLLDAAVGDQVASKPRTRPASPFTAPPVVVRRVSGSPAGPWPRS
jgi:hypothetical protein